MVKVKVLQRSEADHAGTAGGIARHSRNADPLLHPLERAREYQRALTAVKVEKIFAKPFVKALDGHTDSVKCMTAARRQGAPLITGSCDGVVRVWDLNSFTCKAEVPRAHEGFVRGVVATPDGDHFISCGDDKSAKMWALHRQDFTVGEEPVGTYHMASIPNAVDHHWKKPMFVTVSDTVDVWDYSRSTPLSSFEWGCERIITARYNPAEPALIASTAIDRSIGLYDLRGNSAIRKVLLKMRSNAVCWNPMNPLNFTVANEDSNCYTFDMRKLNMAIGRHWDHTQAVLDVAYNPNGQEFVTASYDATIRIFKEDSARSRDVYHTKRMQRVLCCHFTPDGRFVLSGSEDTNVRVWKAKSDQKLGAISDREKHSIAYRESLKEKFNNLPEIKRIRRHHHVPKAIKNATEKKQIMREARARKDANRRKHSKPGSHPHVPMKKRQIIKEID